MDEVHFFNCVVLPKCFIAGMLSVALSFLLYLTEFESLFQAFVFLSLCITILTLFFYVFVRRHPKPEQRDGE